MGVLSKLSDWRVLLGGGTALLAGLGVYGYKRASREVKSPVPVSNAAAQKRSRSEKVAVDGVFFRRLISLLKICVPRPFCAETFFILMVAVFMILRTFCDLWMIRISTFIESVIVSRNRERVVGGLLQFMVAMLPIAIVNNVLKYGLEELVLRFRTRLTKHLFEQYLSGFTYYKINNLDNRISNPDQLLTQDLEKFCRSVVDLYTNISKPLLDIAIYAYKLTAAIGAQGPSSMLAYLVLSGFVLTALRKPTGRFTVHEQRLEGEFRYVNSRLITNSEEIAFYQGNERERQVLDNSFKRLVSMLRRSMQFRFSMGIVDHCIGKYLATTVGFYIVSRPFVDLNNPKLAGLSHSEIMEEYYRSGRMLLNLAQGVGRLVLAGRELTRLAGFTARMDGFIQVLNDLNDGRYTRTMVRQSCPDIKKANILVPGSGEIIEVDHLIKFEKVPLVTPNGDILLEELSFEVKSGMNVLVCGPNGCGKSSLFRTLGELWPVFGGRLHKPKKEHLFYVPQRPYMTLGTLRDQIIYPHSKEDLVRNGVTDETLYQYLDNVHLAYLCQREGGWDSVADWMDVLSGGEKQRVAMARLFYHRPQFAILDECTSAVSVDVEGFMYKKCRELGITLFTVSHRKSLWEHHEYVLQFDGRGEYEFKPISDVTQFGS